MKRPFDLIAPFIARTTAFAGTLLIGIVVHACLSESPVWLSTSSPNKTYTVELTGDKGRGGFLFYSFVKYNLKKNGQPIAKNVVAHSGDFMDISFELAYPEHAWIDENVLRFWRNPDRLRDARFDTLLISNDAPTLIKHLKIKTKDMFIVFDVQPHSTLKLLFTHQYEGNGVAVEGEFEGGHLFKYGVGFPQSNSNDPLGYCMVINDDHVTIESPKEAGYDYRGDWDNLNIAKSARCKV